MSRDARIRIGVAGLGRIGALHAEHLAGRVPFADLRRVIDVDEQRARDVGRRLGVNWSTDLDGLISDPEIDALIVATPTPTHPDVVEAAAAAGKAVFCEKPLALSDERALEAIQRVEDCGVLLQVGLHMRFDPDTRHARRRIHDGDIGAVYSFRTSLRDMTPQPMEYIRESGSFFVDVTIHSLDLARWLVGEIAEVSVFGGSVSDPEYARMGTVDHAVVVVRFENGALGTIDNSRVAGYGYEASTEIVGADAAVRIEHSQRTNVVTLARATARLDLVTDFVERFRDAYRDELVDFVEAVRSGRGPAVTGWDALAAFSLAEACQQSFESGRPVQLEIERHDSGVRYRIAKSVAMRDDDR